MSQSTSTLIPGFKQVNNFGPDEEYEEDEEVSYCTLDLGNIEPTLIPTSRTYRLIVSK
jgi:general transcription factor 3C polypeptide 6